MSVASHTAFTLLDPRPEDWLKWLWAEVHLGWPQVRFISSHLSHSENQVKQSVASGDKLF